MGAGPGAGPGTPDGPGSSGHHLGKRDSGTSLATEAAAPVRHRYYKMKYNKIKQI